VESEGEEDGAGLEAAGGTDQASLSAAEGLIDRGLSPWPKAVH
jgi:hypothetical protein